MPKSIAPPSSLVLVVLVLVVLVLVDGRMGFVWVDRIDDQYLQRWLEIPQAETSTPLSAARMAPVPKRPPLDHTREEDIADRNDPRWQGWPCHRRHEATKLMSNQFSLVTECGRCALRLKYTPREGCTGRYRRKESLPVHVTLALQRLQTTNVQPTHKVVKAMIEIVEAEVKVEGEAKAQARAKAQAQQPAAANAAPAGVPQPPPLRRAHHDMPVPESPPAASAAPPQPAQPSNLFNPRATGPPFSAAPAAETDPIGPMATSFPMFRSGTTATAPMATPLPARLRRPPSSHGSRRPPSSHGSSCICDDCLDYRDDRDYECYVTESDDSDGSDGSDARAGADGDHGRHSVDGADMTTYTSSGPMEQCDRKQVESWEDFVERYIQRHNMRAAMQIRCQDGLDGKDQRESRT